MDLPIEEVRQIARLAKLSFSESEEEILSQDMGRILDHVSTLNQVDTSSVGPMTHVHNPTHVLRADAVEERLSHEDAFSNAPDSDGKYFRVPKVIG